MSRSAAEPGDLPSPPPPGYSTTDQVAPSVLLNLVPLANSVNFQLGFLGHGPASLQGEVQVKWSAPAESTGEDQLRPDFEKVEVVFRGVEKSLVGCEGGGIELAEHQTVLWGTGAASSSSSIHQGDFPPSSLPFKLDLTPDLPHCIHLGPSSLDYTLTAVLTHSDASIPPITQSVPVHLTRTSPPGSLLAGSSFASSSSVTAEASPSISPQSIAVSDPIALSVRLSRTIFRRSEPVELLVRIEVPSAEVVQELGLRLRTISAELVRTITVGEVKDDDKTLGGNGKGRDSPEDSSARKLSNEIEEVEHVPATTPPHITVLTRSGKSARFSPTRPIVIRLLLHPPSSFSCESITQVSLRSIRVCQPAKLTFG